MAIGVVYEFTIQGMMMGSISQQITDQTENELNTFYDQLHQKERLIASHINAYSGKKRYQRRDYTLPLHIIFNLYAVMGLFYLLY